MRVLGCGFTGRAVERNEVTALVSGRTGSSRPVNKKDKQHYNVILFSTYFLQFIVNNGGVEFD